MAQRARTAYDELVELKQILKGTELAYAIGRTPEAVSRMRRGKALRPQSERALDVLYLVAERLRERCGGDPTATRWALVRGRPELGGRRLVDLLHEGETTRALAVVDIDELGVSDELDRELARNERRDGPVRRRDRQAEAEYFLSGRPELEPVVAALVEGVREHLGDARVELEVFTDEGGTEELVLVFYTPLDFATSNERMTEFDTGPGGELLSAHAADIAIAVEPSS